LILARRNLTVAGTLFLSAQTERHANAVAKNSYRVGGIMIETLRLAMKDVEDWGPDPVISEHGKFYAAKEALRPLIVGPHGISDRTFDEYCRRARMALKFGVTWADTDPAMASYADMEAAFFLAAEAEKTDTPSREAVVGILRTEADQRIEEAKKVRLAEERRQARVEKKVGRTVTLPPLGTGGASGEWVRLIVEAYSDVKLPDTEGGNDAYRLCKEFVTKCLALSARDTRKTG
jgi:hypothetical protein